MDLDQYFHRAAIADRGISVVVPCYNQADELAAVVARVTDALDRLERGHELILVNNGSLDATGALADRLAAANRRIRAVHHARRVGYGAAVRSGLQAAKYPLIFQTDGGCAAGEIDRFLAVIDQADIVCGRRVGRGGSLRQRVMGWLYRWCVRIVFAVAVHDVDCGARLYRRVALRRIPIQSAGRFAQTEILAKATFMGMLIDEVPVSDRCGARPPGDAWGIWRDALRVFMRPQFVADAPPPKRSASAAPLA